MKIDRFFLPSAEYPDRFVPRVTTPFVPSLAHSHPQSHLSLAPLFFFFFLLHVIFCTGTVGIKALSARWPEQRADSKLARPDGKERETGAAASRAVPPPAEQSVESGAFPFSRRRRVFLEGLCTPRLRHYHVKRSPPYRG